METTQKQPTPVPPVTPLQKHLTPLQELIATKLELRRQSRREETQIREQWQAIRQNSGRLIFSGITDILFPHRKVQAEKLNEEKPHFWQHITDNLPYYLAIVREGLSLTWYIARPFYLKWLMKRKK